MKQSSGLLILVVFSILTLVIVGSVAGGRMANNAEMQLKISFMVTSLGSCIALLSGLMLLIRAASGRGVYELTPLILPLLAGVLIAGFHWSAAVVIGVLGLSTYIREMVGTPQERRGEG